MSTEELWAYIVKSYTDNPRDVSTAPKGNAVPVWFYVFGKDGKIFIEKGREHELCSKMKTRRMLDKENLAAIYELHLRRNTSCVNKAARQLTRNRSYWFGIFADLNL